MCISRGCAGRAGRAPAGREPCDKPAALVKAAQPLIPEFRTPSGALETGLKVADLWQATRKAIN
ncbi:hypothetical protein D1O30_09235 [Methylocystis hirsuta]|uniref:Uncharacterized protein n=1 Tax=Methylocystis hirsuta TaxID=369798 RepID=A0A3M9XSB1_9HYPH|nr:hypothetical protein D1O30_09235 [Methylocystis hirsuta]